MLRLLGIAQRLQDMLETLLKDFSLTSSPSAKDLKAFARHGLCGLQDLVVSFS